MSQSRFKLVPLPQNYRDADSQTMIRLTADIKKIVGALNQGIMIPPPPAPTNIFADGSAGYGLVSWDDVADDMRKYIDGARIWRAQASVDPNTSFDDNSGKTILVNCVRTTKWPDAEAVTPGDYIYWVQWINIEGIVSTAAGGFKCTVI